MPGTAVIGLQWGDEAKGKIVDLLTSRNDIVVRYQGGANAGHTVVAGDKKYKLSLIPSGIFHSHVQCVVAGGVVLHPKSMLAEIDTLTKQGVSIQKNLMISDRTHVIFPWHLIEDALFNKVGNTEAIGTTMRGIGPCYRDKVGRTLAVRLGDLYQPDFQNRIAEIIEAKNRMFGGLMCDIDKSMGVPGLDVEFNAKQIVEEYLDYAERLRPFVADTTDYLLNAVDGDKNILFEGAQGSLLDVDHGTFPYVTGSNSSAAGICGGSGVPLHFIKKIIGVVKAYTTRVGGGPCPTEQNNDIGVKIRTRGNEIGTVTKRPRRCGWFDAVAVRYSVRLGGVDSLCLTLLDVLSTFDTIQICTAYELDGQQTRSFPSSSEALRRVKPLYETLPGWQDDLRSVKTFSGLPAAAQNYVKRISELIGKPVEIISVGPDREQTIEL
ncbi:MAG: adenylosuccinate synthase [Planctomycetaceae bacterium]|nr:adenylosuccinate synthase [Planctomycetaceae bacterium]